MTFRGTTLVVITELASQQETRRIIIGAVGLRRKILLDERLREEQKYKRKTALLPPLRSVI